MDRIGDAWADDLPLNHREALVGAASLLVDEFFEDAAAVEVGEMSFSESRIGILLPRKYALRYNWLFGKRFFACLMTVIWKLAQTKPVYPILDCTAEELALKILIKEAKSVLEMSGDSADFSMFEDVVFQDLDFEMLYRPELDGIEDGGIGKYLGSDNLQFARWFVPFDNAATVPHPYATD